MHTDDHGVLRGLIVGLCRSRALSPDQRDEVFSAIEMEAGEYGAAIVSKVCSDLGLDPREPD